MEKKIYKAIDIPERKQGEAEKNGSRTVLEGDVGCGWVWRSQILDLSKGFGNSWYKNVTQHY